MKKCCTCKVILDDTEFARNQDRCRDCAAVYYRTNKDRILPQIKESKQRQKVRNSAFILDYLKTHPCVDCGESDPIVLEFDHVGEKSSEVSKLRSQTYSIARIQKEIDECVVRCANCHRRVTYSRMSTCYKTTGRS